MSSLLNTHEVVSKILQSYNVYYDIEKCTNTHIPLVAKCEFHVHNQKYVLVKKATLWEADSNEYVYIFEVDNLTKELFIKCKNYAYENGMSLINPKPGHMYSYITTLFVCNSCEEGVDKLIKKCKIFKNFKFSFNGWMDFRTCCLNISDSKIYGNKSGKDTTKFFKNLLSKNI
ncbi:hypothetical protein [Romboutsia sp. 1001713B170207_170306_H8]|uniref:hypothetical protein n=1 Tax=Romboutsia sp. 1001713B170207_170306_H8 TaxID=2787112 RepID=UPI0008224FB3|nr:hypothetical protein [Romboutsia sp. 1001713B170207_170306_H8]SCG98882.1 Uncharacterised protein [uncultured Clostridium sp.]